MPDLMVRRVRMRLGPNNYDDSFFVFERGNAARPLFLLTGFEAEQLRDRLDDAIHEDWIVDEIEEA
jgi:hypothetical protein